MAPSPPSLESAWLTGGGAPSKLNGGILDTFSELLRAAGLVLLVFSWPVDEPADRLSGKFDMLSDAMFKARIGEVREEARGGAVFDLIEDLSANFALGGNGVSGEGV